MLDLLVESSISGRRTARILEGRGPILGPSTNGGQGVSPWKKFEKHTCNLVHYIASVA